MMKLVVILGALVLAIMLAGCTTPIGGCPEVEAPAVETPELPGDEASCIAAGGTWSKIGSRPVESCNLPTIDAGKECSDGGQCQGTCISDAEVGEVCGLGRCSDLVVVVGCYNGVGPKGRLLQVCAS